MLDVDIQQLLTAMRESPFIHLSYQMSGGMSHITTHSIIFLTCTFLFVYNHLFAQRFMISNTNNF